MAADVRDALKSYLAAGRAGVRERFEAGGLRGVEAARAISDLTDQVVTSLYRYTVAHAVPPEHGGADLSVLAVGGYGRAEMAPHSDVDILFLLPHTQSAWAKRAVEAMLYVLWDLGLKVGHATRTVDECVGLAKSDITIRTSVLESRFLCGDEAPARELRRRFRDEIAANTGPAFVEAKLAERDARHRRLGDSRYLVEPNVKDGKGGLRDLHTLFWIAKYLYQVDEVSELVAVGVFTPRELRRFEKAQNFLWAVRIQLHFLAGRAEERVTFDVQSELGARLGYKAHSGAKSVERFMKHYYLHAKEVGDLTRIFCAMLEDSHPKPRKFSLFGRAPKPQTEGAFVLHGSRVDVRDPEAFVKDARNLLRLFHIAQAREMDIHPRALRLVTQNLGRIDHELRGDAEAGKLFVEMLTSRNDPESTLRRMNEAGVFGRFMPDFGRVVAQMQHDMYHVYTVDEHTIRAIGVLAELEAGKLADDHPLSDKIVHKVLSRRTLYLSVLLHDIAKGRGGNHSVLGAEVAERVAPLLGLEPEETETVAWLVLHHLDMSRTALRRDLSDPKTIRDFAELVQSTERLRLLLILTVVDIRAVGPGRWNGWSAQLLRELYYLTEEYLAGGDSMAGSSAERVARARADLDARLADWTEPERRKHAARFYANYWGSFDLDTQERHARFLRSLGDTPGLLEIDAHPDPARDSTEVTVYTPDHAGLFAGIAGAMAASGVDIVSARVTTTTDGMALQSLAVQAAGGGQVAGAETLAQIKRTIDEVLTGKRNPAHLIRQRRQPQGRTSVFTYAPRVLVDNAASDTHTVVEVNGRDRRGFLYTVTRALTDLGVSIASARIATYGERAVDVFYIRDLIGKKITSETRIEKLRAGLLAALAEDSAPGQQAPGAAAE